MDASGKRWIRRHPCGGRCETERPREGAGKRLDAGGWDLLLSFILLVTVVLAAPSTLYGQGCGESELAVSPGVIFPPDGGSLSQAHAAYLRAWNAERPDRILSLLATEARGLVRTSLLNTADLRTLLELAVAELRLETCSVFLVEDVGEWVSVGTYVRVGSRSKNEPESITGTVTTIWKKGLDGEWRIVFVSALWLSVEGQPPPVVAGGASEG